MILKLKRTPGIYLVGFMGSGKTTVGELLADRLGWRFVDLDGDIEAEQGTSIAELFDTRGELAFREIETAALRKRVREIERGTATVVALGGGAFMGPTNARLVAEHGVTVWLNCPFPVIVKRTEQQANDRPLARDPERFEALYNERLTAYQRAEYHIPIENDDPLGAVAAILRLPLF
jgi:shikimate kinase